MSVAQQSKLALHGGPKAVQSDAGDMFTWPIITQEDENAVLEVLRRGGMSGTDVTRKFEEDLMAWFGMDYALCHNTGTSSIQSAMYACGVRTGDEVICQSMTFWGSTLQVFSLGGTVVFGEIDADTLLLVASDRKAWTWTGVVSAWSEPLQSFVADHHREHPLLEGPLLAEARQALQPTPSARVFEALCEALCEGYCEHLGVVHV